MNRTMGLGFVFVVALLIVGFATLILGDLNFGETHDIRIHFPSVQGLKKGDDVRVEGVLAGKVNELALDEKSGVMVVARLDRKISVFQDADIFVESSSVLGGNFISINRGAKAPEFDLTQPLAGKTRPGLEAVGDLAAQSAPGIKQFIASMNDMTKAINEGRGTIGKAIQSPQLYDEATATLKEMKQTVVEARAEVKRTSDNINKIVEKVDKGEGPLGAILNDKKMTSQLQRTLDNAEKTSENLSKLTQKMDSGEGVLPRLLNDKKLGKQLENIVEDLEKSADSIRNITGRLESDDNSIGRLLQDEGELFEKTRKTVEDIDKVFAKVASTIVEVVGDSKLYDDSSVIISKMGIRITPGEDKYFFVGAAFLGLDKEGDILFKNLVEDDESDTIIKPEILIAYRIPWFLDRAITVRAGLIEGKPGGAVDFLWSDWGLFTHPIQLTFEGRDSYNDLDNEDIDEQLDGPMLRVYAKAPLWTGKDNWFQMLLSTLRLYIGVSRVGEDPEGMIGIGLEWPDEDIKTFVGLLGLAR